MTAVVWTEVRAMNVIVPTNTASITRTFDNTTNGAAMGQTIYEPTIVGSTIRVPVFSTPITFIEMQNPPGTVTVEGDWSKSPHGQWTFAGQGSVVFVVQIAPEKIESILSNRQSPLGPGQVAVASWGALFSQRSSQAFEDPVWASWIVVVPLVEAVVYSLAPLDLTTCPPILESLHVYLNGVEQFHAVDWNLVEPVAPATVWRVVPTAAMDARNGDLLEAMYVCLPGA